MNSAMPANLGLTGNAIKVLEKRYLKRDREGKVQETPLDLFKRVARTIARADLNFDRPLGEVQALEDRFFDMISTTGFLPNSPTLMNAGRRLGQLSACFVLPVGDSMDSIFDAVKNAAMIHKSGGGTGFSFSRLRPTGDVVGSTKGISSGPISFMTVFDVATETIKQGGTRRGANMGLLRVDHPDIIDFIRAKDVNNRLNNFNISVGITEAFMRAVEAGEEYDILNPHGGNVVRRESARKVFDLIVSHAWQNGEPGIVFLDRINAGNPTPAVGEIESTNPCGEQPLLPYESCNLGSINLALMVKDGAVDWDKLKAVTRDAVHFLDNVIEINRYPLKEIEETTKSNRKIGLGVMGWADMLIQLGIPYSSESAFSLAGDVMNVIQAEGKNASEELANMRGDFPNHELSIFAGERRMRNATITTIAPTGTLSIIAGCSSGVEPLFAVSFVRNVLEGTKLVEVNPYFERIAKERGFWSRELIEKISETGSVAHMDEVPDDVKAVFVTAHDISPLDHIKMQAAFQKFTDNAVSKTVNFPNHATKADVEEVYRLAYTLGCKGVTVYRDGSREDQVLSTGSSSQTADKELAQPETTASGKIMPKKRPDVMRGETRLLKTGCGNLYVTINADENGNPFEIFTQMGKAGGCAASQAEAIGRLVSMAFRSNVDPAEIVKQLKGISCHSPAWGEGGRILSCSDAIASAIEGFLNGRRAAPVTKTDTHSQLPPHNDGEHQVMRQGACPECGGAVEHEGGCAVCRSCGFTKCA
ncbi:MAG: vitamin B12-dependent ribonucleotide reductase [Nitrospirae bacterium]|nr:vitamin B12-dependent ribonucleotide reductase [Nitrospirota bacterium]